MDHLFKDLATLINGMTEPSTKVDRTEVAGLIISTVRCSDLDCWETAVLDAEHSMPVERYDLEELAKAGHAKWVAAAPTLTEVTQLGYLSLIEPEVIKLVRMV